MKRCSILFLVLACILSGCFQNASWEFQYGSECVCEIKLVEMLDDQEYSVVQEIDISYAGELFSEIDNLSWKYYGPNLASPCDLCFLITYDSGEYDIISYYEPKHYRFEGGELLAYNSWLCCDQDEFRDVINKYLRT